eukprot:scaffold1323_cov160-Amphora_coffeaeformis.AAC.20
MGVWSLFDAETRKGVAPCYRCCRDDGARPFAFDHCSAVLLGQHKSRICSLCSPNGATAPR